MDFSHSGEIYLTNTGKQLLDATTKNRTRFLKNYHQKAAYRAAEATGEFIGTTSRIKF